MSLITSRTPPSSGEISLSHLSPSIGYCPQFDVHWLWLTAKETLKIYAGISGLQVENWDSYVLKILKVIGLEGKGDRPISEFSGGMKQKLSLGCAFMGGDGMILLDEPTTVSKKKRIVFILCLYYEKQEEKNAPLSFSSLFP